MKRIAIILLIGCLFPTALLWGQEIEYLSSALWSEFESAEISGDRLYISFHNGIFVWDISNPEELAQMGGMFLDQYVVNFTLENDLAYSIIGWEWLKIIDFSNPAYPQIIGNYYAQTLEGCYPMDATVQGDFAYMAIGYCGLLILDISNPANPDSVGGFIDYDGYSQIVVNGDKACAVSGDSSSISFFDITNPTDPELIAYETGFYAISDIVLQDNYAYIVMSGVIIVYDLTSGYPIFIIEYPIDGWAREIEIHGNLGFIACEEFGLTILRFEWPEYPELIVTFPCGYSIYSVCTTGNNTFLTGAGLFNIDTSDPYRPYLVNTIDVVNASNVGVFASGSYAFVANRGYGLYTLNVSNPYSLSIISALELPGMPWDLRAYDNYVYVAGREAGLLIVDITNPLEPDLVGQCLTYPYTFDLCMYENHVYTASVQTGIYVIDVSDPTNPFIVTLYDETSYGAYGLTARDDLLYVADGAAGLLILSISEPESPQYIGSYDCPGIAHDVVLKENFLYMANDYGFVIFDISDPTSPILISQEDTPGRAFSISIEGDFLAIADGARGLQVYDVSNPSTPEHIGQQYSPCGDVHYKDGYIYNAGGSLLSIFRISQTPIDLRVDLVPLNFSLSPNYPNPFNASTTIEYSLPQEAEVTIEIYDILGRKVETLVTGRQPAGSQTVVWDAKDTPSGVYFFRIKAGEYSRTHKCVLLK